MRRGRHAADGELRGAVQEAAPVDHPVHIAIEELQDLRMEIVRR
jgi:hypothetical protein